MPSLPMFHVITIGSALVDIFIHSKQFESQKSDKGQMLCQLYGAKVDIEGFRVYTGGGSTNTAVGFSRLGLSAAALCETGRDDFAKIVTQDLEREHVSTQLVIAEKKEQTGGSIVLVGAQGGRTVLVHRGAASMLDTFDIPPYWLSQTRWVHLSSIGGRKETLEKIFLLIRKSGEVGLSWNPGQGELALLKDNELEIESIPCKIAFFNKEEWRQVSVLHQQLLRQIPHIIVTDGKNGGDAYINGKHSWRYLALPVESVDDTGAGDAFATGYVAAHLLGKKPQAAIEWAVKNASSVVRFYGAKLGLLDRKRIEAE